MQNNSPLVSVLLAVYNGEKYILAALESIVQQQYRPLEILVIDDGSTDSTGEIVRNFASRMGAPDLLVRYLPQAKRGQGAAQNIGLHAMQGEIVAFIDADDLWPPDKLAVQLPYLAQSTANPVASPGIVLGRIHYFVDAANVNPVTLARANSRPVHFALGSSLFARWAFAHVGDFDATLQHGADWDWFLRARTLQIPMTTVAHDTLSVRIHTENMTRQRDREALYITRLVNKHLQHQRRAGTEPTS